VSAAGNAILTRHYRSLRERQLCVSRVVMRVSDARMDRAISSHRHLIDLLAAGTKADFLAATREHLRLAHEQASSVR
ncbi:MAG: FCD domain-containing protein, partial [Chloroflexota bacterium]|nr:FCD domain-containing protein [Chloroflexota bacterium]